MIVLGAKPTRTESQSPSPANCQVRSGSSHSNTTPKLQQPATQHSITAIAVAGLNTGCNAQVTGSLAQTASRDGTQDLLPLAECGMAVACCGSPLSTMRQQRTTAAHALFKPEQVNSGLTRSSQLHNSWRSDTADSSWHSQCLTPSCGSLDCHPCMHTQQWEECTLNCERIMRLACDPSVHVQHS